MNEFVADYDDYSDDYVVDEDDYVLVDEWSVSNWASWSWLTLKGKCW